MGFVRKRREGGRKKEGKRTKRIVSLKVLRHVKGNLERARCGLGDEVGRLWVERKDGLRRGARVGKRHEEEDDDGKDLQELHHASITPFLLSACVVLRLAIPLLLLLLRPGPSVELTEARAPEKHVEQLFGRDFDTVRRVSEAAHSVGKAPAKASSTARVHCLLCLVVSHLVVDSPLVLVRQNVVRVGNGFEGALG